MKRAFTIIELMVSLVIIALLLTAAVSGLNRARQSGRDALRIRDILSIGAAIDQSATANRGVYPSHTITADLSTFCANALMGSNNINKLNLSLFVNHIFPTDPLPELKGDCTDYRRGYTYHSRYRPAGSSVVNLARPAVSSTLPNYEYVLEVGLEKAKPADESVFQVPTDAYALPESSFRLPYLLFGKPCTPGVSGTCSIP